MDTLDKILLLMKQKRLKQKSLANELELNETVFSDWKKGKSKSYLKYIYHIADFLETSPEYLLGKTDVMTSPTTEQQDDFIKLLNDLSVEEKEKIKEYIKFIKTQRKK